MKLNIANTRKLLQAFKFRDLFIEELGWENPKNSRQTPFQVADNTYTRTELAHLSGITVYQITTPDGNLPNLKACAAVHTEISKLSLENLLVFVNVASTQSLWYWVKYENHKKYPREHYYFKDQPGDLFLTKLNSLVVELAELENNPTVTQMAEKLRLALDVERITKKFYNDFKDIRLEFIEYLQDIKDAADRRWYASVLLNRLMFIYFLQRKGFVDNGRIDYLYFKFRQAQQIGPDRFYRHFLRPLFFEGFAKPTEARDTAINTLLGNIVYLNGSLFLPHPVELRWPNLQIADKAFDNLLNLFDQYSWNLDDTPGGKADEINPDVLGYIFEKYINQKEFGAYYTRPEITEYLCRQTIEALVLDKVKGATNKTYTSIGELISQANLSVTKQLWRDILPKISLLDPACGSGAFLIAALKTLVNIYFGLVGRIHAVGDVDLKDELRRLESDHRNLSYYIKRKIITENLYGVDIMQEAVEIARLRLFLTLVASVHTVNELEPLPNIDFNLLAGNSLIGFLHVDEQAYQSKNQQASMFQKPYHELVAEKNRKVTAYRDAPTYSADLQTLRDDIQQYRDDALPQLNDLLLDEFANKLNIKYEQATWDDKKGEEGKTLKRALRIADIEALQPFHWGFEFDRVLNERGGFDAIITNPPWEIFKPQAKEFFMEYSDLVTRITKKTMTIEDFEVAQRKLLENPEIKERWLEYLSRFPYQNDFFRSAPQYANQKSNFSGNRFSIDINLFKLFTEQSYNLLRPGGQCGIVIPSGIYTDLGTKQLREMLFGKTIISGLFCFENRETIFEGVHRSFKFVVLTFEKGGQTEKFPTAFMRHEVTELEKFPKQGAIEISVELVRRLSPDSLSVMEFKHPLDTQIVERALQFPSIGEKLENHWNLHLGREFHMTDDKGLFNNVYAPGRLPLYEGKMIHQFTHKWENTQPRYWVNETEGRKSLLGKAEEKGQILNYQFYRLAYRSIASSTNERTLISTILPTKVFAGNSLNVSPGGINARDLLIITSLLNSFMVDYLLRQTVSANINTFFIYQLRVPRNSGNDTSMEPIVSRAARLICTTSEFKELWEEVMATPWSPSVSATSADERAILRAELDGLVAHLYGLTEEEFAHVLSTFPLVSQPIKLAVQNSYRDFAPKSEELQLLSLIKDGENKQLEFKRNAVANKEKIVLGVAAFLNSPLGGTMLIGVEDTGSIVGVKNDYVAANPTKPGRDTYQMFLQQIINSGLDGDFALLYNISFISIQGKDVCRLDIKPSGKPVFLKNGDFYRRNGNQKEKLTSKATSDYIKQRWG